jgi:hypothetical protein
MEEKRKKKKKGSRKVKNPSVDQKIHCSQRKPG